jgi:hypothetical protein
VYIFPSTLVDLVRVWLVSLSASLPIGGVWFFGFFVGGGDSWMKSKISFRAIEFVDAGTGILLLQESSGGPRVVLVRYVVLVLPASFGLKLPVPVLGVFVFRRLDQSWRRLASDPGLCVDVVGAFIIVWHGSLVVMLYFWLSAKVMLRHLLGCHP